MKNAVILLILYFCSMNLFAQYNQNVDTIPNITEHPVLLKRINYISDSIIMISPEKKTHVVLYNSQNGLYYILMFKGDTLFKESYLGLKLNNVDYRNEFYIDSVVQGINIERERFYFKEKDYFDNNFQWTNIYLTHKTGRKFILEFRLYENSFALRYKVYFNQNESYTVNADYSEFTFSRNMPLYYETTTESGYFKSSLESLAINYLIEMPLLVSNDTMYFLISEANSLNHPRTGLKKVRKNTIAVNLSYPAYGDTCYISPWRYVVYSNSVTSFYDSKYVVYALNDSDTSSLSMLIPGKLIRDMRLSTNSAIKCIDFASKMNFQYILFDAGWYGLGYKNEFNPASNPFIVIDSIQMPVVLNYAKEKNINLVLYLNNVAMSNYNMDSAFSLYSSWGVKALKFGFVDGYSQNGRKFTKEMIQKAAKFGFGVIIHDNLRPSGTEHTFLNHLSTEGIRGNEYVTNTAAHTTILPFSRFMIGAADYTFCYKDPDNTFLPNMPVTKGHQLAISVAFFSPVQSIMWYGLPEYYTDSIDVEFFKFLPTTWNDSKFLDGRIGKYVVFARRYDEKWFWSFYTSEKRSLIQEYNFLDKEYLYRRICYFDENGRIKKTIDTVSSYSAVLVSAEKNDGCACILSKTDNKETPPVISFHSVRDTVSIDDSVVYHVTIQSHSKFLCFSSLKIFFSEKFSLLSIKLMHSDSFNVEDVKEVHENKSYIYTLIFDSLKCITDSVFSLTLCVKSDCISNFAIDSVYLNGSKVRHDYTIPYVSNANFVQNSWDNNTFKVYPTIIFNGMLNVEFKNSSEYVISIYDYTGNKVLSKTINAASGNNGKETINISFLKKGLYLIKIDGYPVCKKFIVQ